MRKIPFFLTVDTEGDNIWDRPRIITTNNTERLHKFQELCNKYNIKPIYLTNYEAAKNVAFQKFVQSNISQLEIGFHLHAWNSPEIFDLTGDDFFYQPYLHEYPLDVIENKIDYLLKFLQDTFQTNIISHQSTGRTQLIKLQDTFQTNIISHRGGRYSISNAIFEILANHGIKVDCSVVPGFDWSTSMGDPRGTGGCNFIGCNKNEHEIYPGIIELPVSTFVPEHILSDMPDEHLIKRGFTNIFKLKKLTLRSRIDNIPELKKVVDWNMQHSTHLEYIIHSSELVKGTSSLIKTDEEENLFYDNLEKLFQYLEEKNIESLTFKDYLAAK